jgi:hypothetical protein
VSDPVVGVVVPAGGLVPRGLGTSPSEPAEHILQFFTFEHLKPPLAAVSTPFCTLAHEIVANLPRNPERTAALRKLLEAKDAAVRAFIAKPVAAP